MKQVNLSLAFAIAAIALVSCNEKETVIEQPSLETAKETPYEYVGRLHNEGLDYVLNSLKQELKSTTKASESNDLDLNSLAKQAAEEFVRTKDLSDINLPQFETSKSQIQDNEIRLSEKGDLYQKELDDVMFSKLYTDKKRTKVTDLLALINKDSTLIKDEKELLLYEGTLFLSSMDYWKHSLNFWKNELQPDFSIGINEYTKAGMKIEGRIVDQCGMEIIGASVRVRGTQNGTITDYDGYFSIQANRGDKIEISALGYNSATITASVSSCGTIVLCEEFDIWTAVSTEDAKGLVSGLVSGLIIGGFTAGATAAAAALANSVASSVSSFIFIQ